MVFTFSTSTRGCGNWTNNHEQCSCTTHDQCTRASTKPHNPYVRMDQPTVHEWVSQPPPFGGSPYVHGIAAQRAIAD